MRVAQASRRARNWPPVPAMPLEERGLKDIGVDGFHDAAELLRAAVPDNAVYLQGASTAGIHSGGGDAAHMRFNLRIGRAHALPERMPAEGQCAASRSSHVVCLELLDCQSGRFEKRNFSRNFSSFMGSLVVAGVRSHRDRHLIEIPVWSVSTY